MSVLAVESYERLRALTDADGLLNLAWTLDERDFLAVDLAAIARRELEAEVAEGLPYLNSYFVQDPYGEDLLGPSVAALFARKGWSCSVTCGAGAISLLHALAQLADGGPAYVIGDVYPDFPHWIEQAQGSCVSRYSAPSLHDHVGNVAAVGARIVLVERPSMRSDNGFSDLSHLVELCSGAARAGAVVLVDESYANYHPPSFSAAIVVPEVENLLVVRGLSKGYWLGGLRLGYCVASAALTEAVRSVVPPMLGSSLSLRIGKAVLELGDVSGSLRERVRVATAETTRCLEAAGLTRFTTAGEYVPFVFFDEDDAESLARLAACGILGKRHPVWSEERREIAYLHRLSVPLRPERLDVLRKRLAAAG